MEGVEGGGGGGGALVGGKVGDETKNPEEAGLIRLRITLFRASLGGNSLICTRAGSPRPV